MDSDTLPLGRSGVDRDAHRRSEGIAAILNDPRLRVVRVRNGRIDGDTDGLRFGSAVESDEAGSVEAAYLGRDDEGRTYVADLGTTGLADLPDHKGERAADDPQGPPSGISLRDVGWHLSDRDAGLATAALALANWHANHRFCPRCGAPSTIALAGWERHCAADGTPQFPRTDAAVIMAIVDEDDRLLLGRAATWPQAQFSVPAGFVEPGETLEAAVRREVLEETAIVVGDVTYQASQPWPFPASLMLAFNGRALTREPKPDGVEVTESMFVSRQDLAQLLAVGEVRLPRSTSIAHHLIRQWYGQDWTQGEWVSPRQT